MTAQWENRLQLLRQAWHADQLTASEVCALYVLLHLERRHGQQWLSGPRQRGAESNQSLEWLTAWGFALSRSQLQRLASIGSVTELWQRCFFRGVILDSHEGLVAWLESRYPLTLLTTIPSPQEMLELQSQGRRYVTLMLDSEQQFRPWGRHQDACDFLLHDLEHAHKFFADPELFAGQVTFFQALLETLKHMDRWHADARFLRDLHYLQSDMNSHPVHLIKYLKAIVLNAEIRRTGDAQPQLNEFWRELFALWQMPAPVVGSALRLNHPGIESTEDQIQVRDFFTQRKVHGHSSSVSHLHLP
jgi:hypothetical protein